MILFEELSFPGEIWRPIKGWGDKYFISSRGRVISRYQSRNILKYLGDNGRGYKNVVFTESVNGKKVYKANYVHRLVAKEFIPNEFPEIRNHVNHIDGDRGNNSVENLEWVTVSENHKHRYRRTGRESPNKKIGMREVSDIRKSYLEYGKSGPLITFIRDMCIRHGISSEYVRAIYRNRAYMDAEYANTLERIGWK